VDVSVGATFVLDVDMTSTLDELAAEGMAAAIANLQLCTLVWHIVLYARSLCILVSRSQRRRLSVLGVFGQLTIASKPRLIPLVVYAIVLLVPGVLIVRHVGDFSSSVEFSGFWEDKLVVLRKSLSVSRFSVVVTCLKKVSLLVFEEYRRTWCPSR
jgi:hypothetical protein